LINKLFYNILDGNMERQRQLELELSDKSTRVYRIAVIGDKDIGKTYLISKLNDRNSQFRFNGKLGMNFEVIKKSFGKYVLFDCEMPPTILNVFYKGFSKFILMFDIDASEDDYTDRICHWMMQIQTLASKHKPVKIFFLGLSCESGETIVSNKYTTISLADTIENTKRVFDHILTSFRTDI
jgi:hypothetical protein